MKQDTLKTPRKVIVKRIAVVVAVMALVAACAGVVWGYLRLQDIDQRLGKIDENIASMTPSTYETEQYTDENGETSQLPAVEFALIEKQTRTVQFATSYDQVSGEPGYEPRQVLEVKLRVTNNTDGLYDVYTRFFASTADGELSPDVSSSISPDDVAGPAGITVAPKRVGTVVLYFEVDGSSFTSIFADDTLNYGNTSVIEL